MLRRKIQDRLVKWCYSEHKKALLLTGARQVGKTTAIREFAKAHYDHFVEINFIKNPSSRLAFDGELTTSAIRANLTAMGFGPFVKGKTLVFLDEIQECPNARTAIKFLVEESEYDYVESGSLLGISYKEIPSYPVGFEEELCLYPMDFEEFLWAKGISQETIDLIRNSYQTIKPVPEFIHKQVSRYYREYLVVGGMPEVVQCYVTTNDFSETIRVQKSIITSYRSDITKYAGRQQTLVRNIFNSIPSELGKQNKRFILANLEKGASMRKYENPTQWLVDAGIAYYSFNVKSLSIPLEAEESRNLFKLYMDDTGLLCSTIFRGIQFRVKNEDLTVNEGALTENFVASQLASKDFSLHYYDKKSKQELDFVFEHKGKIQIVEVKSGNDYKRHTSLDAAISQYDNTINRSIVLCKGNLEVTEKVLYLPLYMTMFL